MEHLISQLPDEDAVRNLAQYLRSVPEDVALRAIKGILESNSRVKRLSGLKVAKRTIRNAMSLLFLIDIGLARKDVSEIQFWLEMAAPSLGYRRLLKHLIEIAQNEPEWIVHAWYQLVPMIRKNAGDLLIQVEQLQKITDQALANRSDEVNEFWTRTKAAVK